MASRLITLTQIKGEKINRSRSWFFALIAAGRFPKPIGGPGPNLWEEEAIDRWLEEFIAQAKERSIAEEEAKKRLGRRLVRARQARDGSGAEVA